jgi:hypothetical protein
MAADTRGRPRISVVIPTFERRGPVLAALASVDTQTYPAHEVIVVDDGSTDGTADAVRARYGDAVCVIEQANQGPSIARNTGCREATGDLIAFLDSDNRWRPHHLATVAAMAERFPDAVLLSTQRTYRSGDETVADAECADLAERLLLHGIALSFTTGVAVRRDAFDATGGFDPDMRWGEDVDLFLRVALEGPVASMRAYTFDVADEPGLYAEGLDAGKYLDTLGRSADNALAALEHSSRPDAERLRQAARARRALGEAVKALARGASVPEVRSHLAEMCDRAPSVRRRPTSAVIAVGNRIPGWDSLRRRATVLTTFVRAWPDRWSMSGAQIAWAAVRAFVRPTVRASALRQV